MYKCLWRDCAAVAPWTSCSLPFSGARLTSFSFPIMTLSKWFPLSRCQAAALLPQWRLIGVRVCARVGSCASVCFLGLLFFFFLPPFQSPLIVLLSSQGPSVHLLAPTYSSRHECMLYYIRLLRAFYYICLSFFVCLVWCRHNCVYKIWLVAHKFSTNMMLPVH